MTLEEAEKLARDCVGFLDMKLADIRECRRMEAVNTLMEYGIVGAENSAILARFILRVLPVLRTAIALTDAWDGPIAIRSGVSYADEVELARQFIEATAKLRGGGE
jgi:hypothetical protein